MAFTFKKDEIKDLNGLKERDEELYNALVTEARSGSDELIASLQAEVEKIEASAKIKNFATKLNLSALGDELVEKDTPYNEACEALLNAYEVDDEADFLGSAPDAIGAGSGDGEDEDGPQTFNEAILLISERDSISKGEAAEKAKIEFSELLTKTVS